MRVRICARWRERDHATVGHPGQGTGVGVGLLASCADDPERHDEQNGERKWDSDGDRAP
jgi:hypothetical protein